jgi:hypothetical protein
MSRQVDPFSTGALMAASVMRRGLKLAIVWSDAGTRAEVDTMQHMQRDDDPGIIESRAPQEGYGTHHCSALETPVIIHNAGSATSVAAAVSATAAAIKAIGDIILAVSAKISGKTSSATISLVDKLVDKLSHIITRNQAHHLRLVM